MRDKTKETRAKGRPIKKPNGLHSIAFPISPSLNMHRESAFQEWNSGESFDIGGKNSRDEEREYKK